MIARRLLYLTNARDLNGITLSKPVYKGGYDSFNWTILQYW